MALNFDAEERVNKIPLECKEGRNEKLVMMEGITLCFVWAVPGALVGLEYKELEWRRF